MSCEPARSELMQFGTTAWTLHREVGLLGFSAFLIIGILIRVWMVSMKSVASRAYGRIRSVAVEQLTM